MSKKKKMPFLAYGLRRHPQHFFSRLRPAVAIVSHPFLRDPADLKEHLIFHLQFFSGFFDFSQSTFHLDGDAHVARPLDYIHFFPSFLFLFKKNLKKFSFL